MIKVGKPMKQFDIHELVPFELGQFNVAFTNSALWMVIGILVMSAFIFMGTRRASVVPGRFQAVVELFYEFVFGLLHAQTGDKGLKYFPFVFCIFSFVLMGNLLGLIPHSFTYTSHLAVTFALAFIVIVTVTLIGIARHGLHFFSLFLPSGTPLWMAPLMIPLEVTSYLMRPVSLSLRLFINMMVGHILLKVFAAISASIGIAGLLPTLVNVGITGLELLIAFIQAYIFALLTSIYLKDSIDLH